MEVISDEPFAGSQGGGLGAIVDDQLGNEIGDVGLHGAGTDEERLCDFAVRFAQDEEAEHISLARGKGVGIGGSSR